ncbi:hypothetical protein IVB22_21665 [Bradyrhizobium sp. 190]|uniref:hypothetical protein n=1 Tax=Bradyrhizobium sp. 190 TaxID=2782658 RepID=UPI001FFA4A07|nr:hypothetical protein [Bradyrhizobium sp. 190]MCK1515121.1 hypothetical protein [Bradyrhizobium sp. 190]
MSDAELNAAASTPLALLIWRFGNSSPEQRSHSEVDPELAGLAEQPSPISGSRPRQTNDWIVSRRYPPALFADGCFHNPTSRDQSGQQINAAQNSRQEIDVVASSCRST